MAVKLALIDLDHTLIPLDSDYAWGVFTTTIGWTDPVEFAQRNDDFFAHYKAGTLDITITCVLPLRRCAFKARNRRRRRTGALCRK